mmetsp:Transcript_98230/g.298127  ORF Transcript_98230/g.298127 Transcript_98230/m.298127 type:complete len:229 (-) Transcript_98230:101-787(-)
MRFPSSRRWSKVFIVAGARPSSMACATWRWTSWSSLPSSRKVRPWIRYFTELCSLLVPESSCSRSSMNSKVSTPSTCGPRSSAGMRSGLTALVAFISFCASFARSRGMGTCESSQKVGSCSSVRWNSRNLAGIVKLWLSPCFSAHHMCSSLLQGTVRKSTWPLEEWPLAFCRGSTAFRSWCTVSLSGTSRRMSPRSASWAFGLEYFHRRLASSMSSSVEKETTVLRRE